MTSPDSDALQIMPPPVTHDQARRIDDAITAHMELRLNVGMVLPGNPGAIAVQYFGHAMASLARHVPFPYMNLVYRFRVADIDQLDAIADFYGNLDFGIEVIPSDLTPEVVDRFIDLGAPHDAVRHHPLRRTVGAKRQPSR